LPELECVWRRLDRRPDRHLRNLVCEHGHRQQRRKQQQLFRQLFEQLIEQLIR
jgi:hypothetical protein